MPGRDDKKDADGGSRNVNKPLLAVGGGGLSALIFVAPFWGGPIGVLLMYLAPAPLLAAGLGLGSQAVIVAAGAGLITVAFLGSALAVGSFAVAGVYAGLHALPACLVIYQALMKKRSGATDDPEAWFPPGAILASLTALGGFAVLGIALAMSGETSIEDNVRTVLMTAMEAAGTAMPTTDLGAVVDTLAPTFLGFGVVMWVTTMVLNGVLVQGFLTRRQWNIRPRPQWSALALPDWLSWPIVISAAVALVADGDAAYVARNLVILFAVPYFFLGLAVVHSLLANVPQRTFVLVTLYACLFLFFVFAAGILAALGLAEQWAGVRSRFQKT